MAQPCTGILALTGPVTTMDLDTQDVLIQELTTLRKRHLYACLGLDHDDTKEAPGQPPSKRQRCEAIQAQVARIWPKIECVPRQTWQVTDAIYGPLRHIQPTYTFEFPLRRRVDRDGKHVDREAKLVEAKILVTYSGQNVAVGEPLVVSGMVLFLRGQRNRWTRPDWRAIVARPDYAAEPEFTPGKRQALTCCQLLTERGFVPGVIPPRIPVDVKGFFPKPMVMVKGVPTVEPINFSIRVSAQKPKALPVPYYEFPFTQWPLDTALHYTMQAHVLRQLAWQWSYAYDPTYSRLFRGCILGALEGLSGVRLRIMQFAAPATRFEPYAAPRTPAEKAKRQRLNREGFNECDQAYKSKVTPLRFLNPLYSTEAQRTAFLATLAHL